MIKMNQCTIYGAIIALTISLPFSGLPTQAQDDPCCAAYKHVGSPPRLIPQQRALLQKFRTFHQKTQEQILEAERLQGEAEYLRSKLPPLPPLKLSKTQLQSATRQYQVDLSAFQHHADAYTQHLKQFKATIGECHANEAAYQAIVKQYQLRTRGFNRSDIPPPHICAPMKLNEEQLNNMAHHMYDDLSRVATAQQNLTREETRLKENQNEEPQLAESAVKRAERQEQEQQMAVEFGKLKQEYDLLSVEKQQITGPATAGAPGAQASPPASLVRESVSGKVKK